MSSSEIKSMRLDLGCGLNKRNGYLGVDVRPLKTVDVITDIRILPVEWQDKIEEVWLDNVLEHFSNITEVLYEVHRVCKPYSIVHIRTPYFTSENAFKDFTHKTFFTYDTFDYFEGKSEKDYSNLPKFKILKKQLRFTCNPKLQFLNILSWLFNIIPRFYERFLSHILPCDDIYFELMVLK